jgi:hypothetical protein
VLKKGAIVRRNGRYGVVIEIGNPHWGPPVRVEWSDGRREWVDADAVEWPS